MVSTRPTARSCLVEPTSTYVCLFGGVRVRTETTPSTAFPLRHDSYLIAAAASSHSAALLDHSSDLTEFIGTSLFSGGPLVFVGMPNHPGRSCYEFNC